MVPALTDLPPGCAFAPRCAYARATAAARAYPAYEEKRPRPLGGVLALAELFGVDG